MYQTYGFPPELFETLSSDRGFAFDWPGFKKEMERHGEISGSAEKNLLFKDDPLAEIKKTNKTEFDGYGLRNNIHGIHFRRGGKGEVVAILADGQLVNSVPKEQTVQVILNITPFYGEKGGQTGDKGCLWSVSGDKKYSAFIVEDTQIDGDLIVHIGHQYIPDESESDLDFSLFVLKAGDEVWPEVDMKQRLAIARAHTATHLLHSILRKELGSHAEQQGSKVDADILRFDFTHHQAVDKETLSKIELSINDWILTNYFVRSEEMTLDEARKADAIMLFGEKYPEKVRVVSIGGDSWETYGSIELCGGTHVSDTAAIGLFKIVSESSVAAGVRRIEAITGQKAVEKVLAESSILQQVASTLKVPVEEIPAKVTAMQEQIKKAQKQLKTMAAGGKISVDDLISGAQIVGGIKIILWDVPDSDIDGLRQLVDRIRTKTESVAMLFSSVQEDKVTLIAGLSKDLVARQFDAVVWIRSVVSIIGGKGGGGNPGMAQAGGKDPTKLAELFAAAKLWFEK